MTTASYPSKGACWLTGSGKELLNQVYTGCTKDYIIIYEEGTKVRGGF